MNAFLISLTTLAEALLKISAQASLVIVLVLGVQWLERKHFSPRVRYALWLLVVLRLALPTSLESRVSVFDWGNVAVANFARGEFSVNPGSEGARRGGGTASPGNGRRPTQRRSPLRTRRQLRSRPQRRPNESRIPNHASRIHCVRRRLPGRGGKSSRARGSPASSSCWRGSSGFRCGSMPGWRGTRRKLRPAYSKSWNRPSRRPAWSRCCRWSRAVVVTLLQILHWFNPLVWFAFARMRADRELVWGDKGGHIKVRELATGTAQRIVSASEKEKTYEFPSGVIWSPNRAMVGYVVITTEAGTTTEQLHVAATDGSWDRIVKTAGQLVRGGIPNWAPDSAAVLLTLRENLPGEIGLLENFLPVEKKVAAK